MGERRVKRKTRTDGRTDGRKMAWLVSSSARFRTRLRSRISIHRVEDSHPRRDSRRLIVIPFPRACEVTSSLPTVRMHRNAAQTLIQTRSSAWRGKNGIKRNIRSTQSSFLADARVCTHSRSSVSFLAGRTIAVPRLASSLTPPALLLSRIWVKVSFLSSFLRGNGTNDQTVRIREEGGR